MAGKTRVSASISEDYAQKELGRFLRAAAAFTGLRRLGPRLSAGAVLSWSATVRLVGAAEMTRLNRRYRGLAYPTDVLSFEAPAVFRAQGVLGELVICKPTLARQAREQGHSPRAELRVLLAHGLLHLLGLDHERSAREAARMQRWENKLLSPPDRERAAGLLKRSR